MKRDYICTVTFDDTGKSLKPVLRKTEKGVSNYANKMYWKYGDKITVQVDYFDDELNLVGYETWHA